MARTKIKENGTWEYIDKVINPSTANNISYDNTGTGMSATNVQNAVSELNSDIVNKVNKIQYSTTEEIDTGNKWLNGETIWEKTYTGTFSASNNIVVLDDDWNAEAIAYDGYIQHTDGMSRYPIQSRYQYGDDTAWVMPESANGHYMRIQFGEALRNWTFALIVRYIK